MTVIAAALFYAFIAFLAVFYLVLTARSKRNTSRLDLNFLEISGSVNEDTTTQVMTSGYSGSAEWTSFALQYLVLLLPICGFGVIWAIWLPELSRHGDEAVQFIQRTIAELPLTDPGLPFPLLVLLGLTPVWLLCRIMLKDSIAFPFVFFHILLTAACCVADLLGLNGRLNPSEYLDSALKWIVYLILFSQAIWAVSYPNPLRSVPFVCLGLAFSIAIALSVFVFANLFTIFSSPTLTALIVYGAFGYGVFGSHLWMLSKVSRTVA